MKAKELRDLSVEELKGKEKELSAVGRSKVE